MLIGPGGDQFRVHRIIAIASRSVQKRDKKFLPQFWTSEDAELWRESDLEQQGRVLHDLPAGLDLGDNLYWETGSCGFAPAPARASAAPHSAPASPSHRVYTSETAPPLKSALKRPAVPHNAEPGPSRTQRSTWAIPPTPIVVPGGVGVHTTSRLPPPASRSKVPGGRGRSPQRRTPAAVTARGQSSGREQADDDHPVRRSSRPRSSSRGPRKASSSQPPLGEETRPSDTATTKRRGRKPIHKLTPHRRRHLPAHSTWTQTGRSLAPIYHCGQVAMLLPWHAQHKRGAASHPIYLWERGLIRPGKRFIWPCFGNAGNVWRGGSSRKMTERDRSSFLSWRRLIRSRGETQRDVTDAEDNDDEDERDGTTPARVESPTQHHRRVTNGSRPSRIRAREGRTPSSPESEDEPRGRLRKGTEAAVKKVGPPQKKKRTQSRPPAPRKLQCYVDIPPMAPIFRTSRGPTVPSSVTVAPVRYRRMVYSPSPPFPSPPPNNVPAAGEDQRMHSPPPHTLGTPQAVTSPVAGPLGSPCHLASPRRHPSPQRHPSPPVASPPFSMQEMSPPAHSLPPMPSRGTPMRVVTPPHRPSPPRSPMRGVTPPPRLSTPQSAMRGEIPLQRSSPPLVTLRPSPHIPQMRGASQMDALERRVHQLEKEIESQRRFGVQLLSQLQMERTTFEHRLNVLEQQMANQARHRSASPLQTDMQPSPDRPSSAALRPNPLSGGDRSAVASASRSSQRTSVQSPRHCRLPRRHSSLHRRPSYHRRLFCRGYWNPSPLGSSPTRDGLQQSPSAQRKGHLQITTVTAAAQTSSPSVSRASAAMTLDLEDEAMLCDQFYRAFRNTGRDGPSDCMDLD
ncbi:hypothetical protein BXZ70DRAFT_1044660 [Cristinia sonorae]|uniref:Uncharacterized protein n=1 Tax=Cristinia sonorae TaxID=1940300 RepID=A0A8K0UFV0_9AGAR|nr:hypothetical protein BXZ70DRAFT_1044660 [Cristinia sonorae]